MATPDRRQSGWWGSISGGLFSSAAKRRNEPDPQPERLSVPAYRAPALENGSHRDTPRPHVKFQEDRSQSPDSPVKRASAAQLSGRKIIERPQGPSGKLSASTIKATNFSAAASPRPMFRSSFAPAGSQFTFTPRGNTPKVFRESSLRASSATPGRDVRASTAESISRGMARVMTSELFPMKIPEPPSNLSGEELAKRVPQNPNRVGSIYADEYLADLCPKDFTEAQRKQFFCILDLRRLKYASDEIYLKKDWRFNILNFAKEYEKSRSLIMLRYGLYEFKSIRPSQEVVTKWKADNGIPDDEAEETAEPSNANETRMNGTEGILPRGAGKRKATDESVKSSLFAPSQAKRVRGAEREPLTETATPALNKGSKKRMADDHDDPAPSKLHKAAAPSPAKTPSATKKFFEQVANSKPSDSPSSSNTFQMFVEPPSATKPKTNAFSSATFGATPNGSTTRSIFENSAKSGSGKLSSNSNIFSHLSDTGSAQASGAENDAGDEGESGDDSEPQEASQSDEPSAAASGGAATPQPSGALFGAKKTGSAAAFPSSNTSSDTGDAAAAGPSLFDRITKGDDGKPKRLLSGPEPPSLGPTVSESEKAASPVKEQRGVDTTWTAGTPIKFGSAQPNSILPSTTPAAQDSTRPATKLFSFGSKPASETAATLFGASVNGSKPSTLFGAPSPAESSLKPSSSTEPAPAKPSAETKSTSAPAEKSAAPAHPMFGAVPGETPKPTFGLDGSSQSKSVFSSTSKPLFGADPNAGPSETKPLFGAPKTEAPQPKSLFGAAPAAGSSETKPLFGSATSQDAPKPTFGLGAAKDASKPLFSFGSGSQPTESKPLFGPAAPAPATATPTFGSSTPAFGSGVTSSTPAAKPLFGSAAASSTLFGSSTPAASGAKDSTAPTAKPLFGGSTTAAPSQATPSFTFGNNSATTSEPSKPQPTLFGSVAATPTPTPSFSFGASQNPAPATPSFSFGAGTATTQAGTTTPALSFGGGATQTDNSTPSFNFGQSSATAAPQNQSLFGSGTVSAPGSFTFGDKAFNNPFATAGAGDASASVSFNFGGTPSQPTGTPSGGMFNFGGGSNVPTNGTSTPVFSFGGGQANGGAAPDQGGSAGAIFNLAPPMGGTSTGTNTPFTFGGASSLATTPAQGTPEPATAAGSEQEGQKADEGDEEQQAQINLTEGGPGEEEEDVVFEVRAKALKLCTGSESGDESGGKKEKSPWKTMGVGPVRLLKHKTTGAVRMLLRGEPRGNIVMNRALLPDFTYKTEKGDKYVKVPTASDSGGLETWMLQVKDAAKGKGLAAALEEHKGSEKKKEKE